MLFGRPSALWRVVVYVVSHEVLYLSVYMYSGYRRGCWCGQSRGLGKVAGASELARAQWMRGRSRASDQHASSLAISQS